MFRNDAQLVRTGECRASYSHLVTPRASQQGGEPRYSVTLLVPKTDTHTKAEFDSAIAAAIEDAVKTTWKGVRPPVIAHPVWDGDGVRKNGTPFGPECKGCWVVTANSKRKPQVVGADNPQVELEPGDIYSGMYVLATVRFVGYDVNGNRGIGCYLNNVCKMRDGEPLGGGASAAVDFGDIQPQQQAQAAPQPQPQPQPQYQPQQPQPQQYAPQGYNVPQGYGMPQGYPPAAPAPQGAYGAPQGQYAAPQGYDPYSGLPF